MIRGQDRVISSVNHRPRSIRPDHEPDSRGPAGQAGEPGVRNESSTRPSARPRQSGPGAGPTNCEPQPARARTPRAGGLRRTPPPGRPAPRRAPCRGRPAAPPCPGTPRAASDRGRPGPGSRIRAGHAAPAAHLPSFLLTYVQLRPAVDDRSSRGFSEIPSVSVPKSERRRPDPRGLALARVSRRSVRPRISETGREATRSGHVPRGQTKWMHSPKRSLDRPQDRPRSTRPDGAPRGGRVPRRERVGRCAPAPGRDRRAWRRMGGRGRAGTLCRAARGTERGRHRPFRTRARPWGSRAVASVPRRDGAAAHIPTALPPSETRIAREPVALRDDREAGRRGSPPASSRPVAIQAGAGEWTGTCQRRWARSGPVRGGHVLWVVRGAVDRSSRSIACAYWRAAASSWSSAAV
jgi:hypothetical protein